MARRLPNVKLPDSGSGQNEEKSQISIEQGGSYAQHRQELRQAAMPTAPDDLMHAAMEAYNAGHRVRLDDRREEQQDSDEAVAYRNYSRKLRKELAVPEVREEAMRLAALTPTLEDDESARRMPQGLEKIMENHAESPDDFVDRVLKKYQ